MRSTSSSAAGREIADKDLETRRTTATPDDLATIIYTSGTTGRPKGCELTHGNFLFEAANVISAKDSDATLANVFQDEGASTLLFLPLAHVFARMIEIGVVMARAELGHTADVKNLLADLATFKPTFILSVPRVFEKVYNSSEQKAEAAGKGKIFRAAAETAIAFSEARDHGGAGLGLKAKHAVFDKLVYGKLRAALGGRVRWAVSGGAPLGPRLGHFYRGIGLTVLEGYGLTETTAASTVNTPGMIKIGTVGRPLPGVSIRIADDGEILIKGGQVFVGYYNNAAGHRRGAARRLVLAPATSASSTRTAACASPAARRSSSSPQAARTSHRRCSRTGCAPTASSASAWSSATPSPTSPAWSRSTKRPCRPGSSSAARPRMSAGGGRRGP